MPSNMVNEFVWHTSEQVCFCILIKSTTTIQEVLDNNKVKYKKKKKIQYNTIQTNKRIQSIEMLKNHTFFTQLLVWVLEMKMMFSLSPQLMVFKTKEKLLQTATSSRWFTEQPEHIFTLMLVPLQSQDNKRYKLVFEKRFFEKLLFLFFCILGHRI